jgi:mono/diheme cytochrome c family protein
MRVPSAAAPRPAARRTSDGRAARPLAAALALLAIGAIAAPALAADDVARGRALVEESCARCHATGAAGDSPLALAPRFRELSRRYPVSAIEEALAEGIMTAHPDMPEFVFAPEDAAAIVAYLASIQAD